MPKSTSKSRPRNAEEARGAILNAAEEVFAEHGFDGARIDAIAEAAGYNKSLIFQYFGDKLGLYTAVLQRIDQQTSELQAKIFAPLLSDESLATDARAFRSFLHSVMGFMYDLLLENPRLLRMIAWEGAEGWQTMRQIASLFNSDDEKLFRHLLMKAQEAGVIRPNVNVNTLFTVAFSTCFSYIVFAPLMDMALPGQHLSSSEELVKARETIVTFIVHGIMADALEE